MLIRNILEESVRKFDEVKAVKWLKKDVYKRQGYGWLIEHGINCNLEWNQGNHFREPDIRIAKAFAWVMEGK